MDIKNIIYVKDIIKYYGKDLRDINLDGKDFTNCDFRGVILPLDRNLFQKCKYKTIRYSKFDDIDFSIYDMSGIDVEWCVFYSDVTFPKNIDFLISLKEKSISNTKMFIKDISVYDFSDVDITGVEFGEYTLLPTNVELFQIIKEKSLINVVLPKGNYIYHNFNNVSMMGTKFTNDSKIPNKKDFFQNLKDKSVNFCVFPSGNYESYDFENISLSYAVFGKNSKIPQSYELLKKMAIMSNGNLGEQYQKDAHLYDLANINYSINISGLNDIQVAILYKKCCKDIGNSKIKINNFSIE